MSDSEVKYLRRETSKMQTFGIVFRIVACSREDATIQGLLNDSKDICYQLIEPCFASVKCTIFNKN
jgi:hypothetical protein